MVLQGDAQLTYPQEGMPAGHCGNRDDNICRLLPPNFKDTILQLNLPRQVYSLIQVLCAAIACRTPVSSSAQICQGSSSFSHKAPVLSC